MGLPFVLELQEVFEGIFELCSEGDDAMLVALAEHFELRIAQVDVVALDADEFGQAHACAVECEQYQVVALRFVVVAKLDIVEQVVDFLFFQEGGQLALGLGVDNSSCGVFADLVGEQQVLVEGAYGAHLFAYGEWGYVFVRHCYNPVAQNVLVERLPVEFFLSASDESPKFDECGVVNACCGFGVAFVSEQIVDELIDRLHAMSDCYKAKLKKILDSDKFWQKKLVELFFFDQKKSRPRFRTTLYLGCARRISFLRCA